MSKGRSLASSVPFISWGALVKSGLWICGCCIRVKAGIRVMIRVRDSVRISNRVRGFDKSKILVCLHTDCSDMGQIAG